MAGEVEKNLESLGYRLPEVGKPLGSYVQSARTGSLLFISGKFPKENGKIKFPGKVGREVTVEEGVEAARLAALSILATAKQTMEDLDRVKRIVQLTGYVAAAPGFLDCFQILDGASDVFVKVYGDRGRHARVAIGVAELPQNACLELQAVLEVE